ncbi:MAG: hypothetical protein WEE64_06510 [Dehalococcoidia bacterium]
MWRSITVGLCAAMLVGITAFAVSPRRAFACSAGPEYDPVATSDVIVEGRFLGYDVLPDTPPGNNNYLTVRVKMDVAHVLKGSVAGDVIALVDPFSLSLPLSGHTKYEWIGSSGACGAFNEDPTGQYAVMGLSRNDDGTYRPSLLDSFYIGEGPQDPEYQRALQRLRSFPGAASLPSLGLGPARRGGFDALPTVGSVIAAVGLAAVVAGLVLRTRVRRIP